ncbi:hypothetical protein EG328_007196 [Venturia inaequalis]|uniref:Uncharacterized protein n=1 Tax=Venturia inaequalis TaxID=5025 RepID=A0A8H3UGM9_VENIN|nr:hypothetical protein EG328_007196 [Venturia inaequalis]RDI84435.1 Kinesin-like protein [Venturia inaequalis]
MSTFNAVRNHLALIQNDADRLLKDINRLEEDHEENRTSIGQCDKEFAQAKAAEDKVHAELEKAWKKTDKFKNKQRKLDRRQADIQSEQAAKWGQYKIKSALVHELRILCRESFAFPKNGKRPLPNNSYDQIGPLKKTKACSAPAGLIEDDEEYGAPVEKAISGLRNEICVYGEEEAELKLEIEADSHAVKRDNNIIKAENSGVKTRQTTLLK